MSGTTSFARLASEARSGCSDSMGELLQRLRPYMLSVANDLIDSRIRPKCSGSDLVQEATIRATKHFRHFGGQTEQDLLRWIVAILKHRMVDVQRAYVTSGKRSIEAEQSLESASTQMPVDSGSTPREQRIAHLIVHINQLAEPSRRIVLLHFREGQSFAEIGKQIGVSHETVRKRWYAALRELGSMLADELEYCDVGENSFTG